MGYQALLFCPDEKTARTVTQVLSELEFSVEACTEPFAAVKKLMGEHFDAVVVDCDNEQNATLLFKSARNSTSNQTSLAVAVVEGQAGVAKAFRIGANLVLTKPINIEQTKGTLRVARGLLRKGDPAKPGASAPAASAAPKPAPKPASPARPAAPVASVPVAAPAPKETPAAWPAAVAAKAAPAAQTQELFEKPVEKSEPVVAPSPAAAAPMSVTPAVSFAAPGSYPTSGAASAPAPAREPVAKPAEIVAEASSPAPTKAPEPTVSEPTPITGSAPTFSYGGSTDTQSSGGSKKIFIGIAAVVVVGIGGYFGWNQLKSHGETPSTPQATTQPSSALTQSTKSNGTQGAVPTSTTSGVETAKASTAGANNEFESGPAPKESATHATAKPEKPSAASTKPAHEEKADAESEPEPEPEPLLVKGGKVPATNTKAAAAESAAPSLIGMATPASAPPPDLVPNSNPTLKPVLQTVSVSQGVSQGLLYKKVAPTYPSGALRMRIEGKVELMATISKEGNINQVKVLSGDGQLSKAAVDAVKQWKYKPYLLNGEPVEIQTQVTVNFKLPN